MQETTGSSTHKVNLSEYTDNTGRHSSHHQEHSVQSQQNNLRTTEEQPSDSRMVQRTRLRTSIKQWKRSNKAQRTNVERRNSIQDQERHNIARDTTATACNKDTAKECAAESHTTSNSVQPAHGLREKTTPPTPQDTAAPHTHQRRSWTRTTTSFRSTSWRRLLVQRRPILEESTHQASEQRFTYQRHRRARHQATLTLETDQGTTSGRKTHTQDWQTMNGQHSKQRHQTSLGQAGQTLRNITSFPTQLESDDEEQQQGTKAKVSTSTQATNTTGDTQAQC